ncbi:MAG: aminotransferase class V-fold PLP-dependent enzyme [Vicingaceae bacterium]
MSSRRSFLKKIGIQSAALTALPMISPASLPELTQSLPAQGEGENFWSGIQEAYSVSRSKINLNNGGVSPQPRFVQEAFEKYMAMSNEAPSYYMWRQLEPSRINIRRDLANLLGCTYDEVVINRNTTEALDTVIFGLDLKKGDEIVLSPYDYPNMRNAWEQRKKRDEIVLRYANFELPSASEDEIVQAFENEMSAKTKLVHITHMINYNGQVLPAGRIATAARKYSSMVLVDGAHSFAHVPFKISDIDCDFFGTSLHKWLCAPFGTGMLYIKKAMISKLWAWAPTDAIADDDIRKFEALGTRSVPSEVAVGQAILFHNNIGSDRKYERLQWLTDYWTVEFEGDEKFISYTPKREKRYGALYTFGISGMKANEIANYLQQKYQIITSPISWKNIEGCRVSPHIYTSVSELEKLKEGIRNLLKK